MRMVEERVRLQEQMKYQMNWSPTPVREDKQKIPTPKTSPMMDEFPWEYALGSMYSESED